MPAAVKLYEPSAGAAVEWLPGDLLFFFGQGFTSRAIEIITRGPSHVGIICPFSDRGPLLCESTTLCDLPCELTGQKRRGVQFHKPADRLASYAGRVARLSLADGWALTGMDIDRLVKVLWHFKGRDYDLRTAPLAGTEIIRRSSLMPYPDLGSLFCSELCAAALMRVGRLPLSNASAYSPASLLRTLRRCGTYGSLEPLT